MSRSLSKVELCLFLHVGGRLGAKMGAPAPIFVQLDKMPGIPVPNLHYLGNQLALKHHSQLANAINSRPQGSLSSNTEPNPRQDGKVQCQAVTLHISRELQDVIKEPAKAKENEVISEENEKEVEAPLEVILKVFKKLHINIPFAEGLEQMPSYTKFMKDILPKKRCLGGYESVDLIKEYSAIIQNKLPPKLKDPRSFTIPCTIGTHFSGRALYDLGARLGEAKPTSITLQLADRSLTYPNRVIEDIIVKVDKFIFPIDFVVLDMEVDSEIPIILGRPFLATGRTLIDVQKGELNMRVQDRTNHFQCESNTLLVIISSLLSNMQREKLLRVLRDHKSAIGWTIADIKGISPSLCMHKILLEDYQKPSVESQRRTNPITKEVVKKEIIKWLDVCIPKKRGITVVPNKHNELIPTRTVIWWRVCMDYRKLNKATRKDHFPLPFINQMLDRLAGKEFYCFLDGYSGYNQITIAPEDQEKIMFTFLGHKVSNSGIKVDKAKLKTIEKLPPHTSVKGILTFLGHAGKDVAFKFDDVCLHAFDELKGRLISAPIITVPHWAFPFELIKTLNDPQLNYTTTDKELLAVVFVFDKFRSYLVGTKYHASPYGGHFQGDRSAAKALQSGFYWPNLFKDAHSFVANCDRCQRTRNISRRHEIPLNTILEVELLDAWGIDFMGPFVPSFGNLYILVADDYVSK
ncbi:DNA-directed DNA polymerase [Handroanthus impetiginosus]|uniref:DNA-directed DNA polymerase n=1 Tax=Handroanthus impetiginosus TaxID=429701 RepID=A0A2G9HT44_9LAMI|nr:DNA-directed DNA polymerase [Handroanthus impetiginosus]